MVSDNDDGINNGINDNNRHDSGGNVATTIEQFDKRDQHDQRNLDHNSGSS